MLPITPYFLEDESLTSYLYRATRSNYRYRVGDCINGLQLKTLTRLYRNVFLEEDLWRISELTGFTVTHLEKRTYNRWLGDRLVQTEHTRYCPLCIQKEVHHKWSWGARLNVICTKHAVILRELCPMCEYAVSINGVARGRCTHCSASLEVTDVEQISRDSHEFKHHREMDLKWDDESRIHLVCLLDECVRLMNGIAAIDEPNHVIHFGDYSKGVPAARELAYALGNVGWMLQSSSHFHSMLQKFLGGPSTQIWLRMNTLKQVLTAPDLQMYRVWFEQLWSDELDTGKVTERNRVFDQGSQLVRSKTLTEASFLCRWKISESQLRELIRDGYVSISHGIKERRFSSLVDENDLKYRIRKMNLCISQREAARRLGTIRQQVTKLINEGLLTVHTQNESSWINARDVSQLLKRCRPKLAQPDGLKSLFETVYESGGRISFVGLLRIILDGDIACYTNVQNYTFNDLFVNSRELAEYLYNHKRGGTYSFNEVTERLQIGGDVLHRLMVAGKVGNVQTKIASNGKARYFFDSTLIDNMVNEYVSVRESALVLNVPVSTVKHWLRCGRLHNELQGLARKVWISRGELKKTAKGLCR